MQETSLNQQQRILYLDFARGLAILFMILQHAMIMFAVNSGESSELGDLILLLGTAPAAPVFMLIMGIFFMRSNSQCLKAGILRGFKLIFLGYILNIFRFSLPELLSSGSIGTTQNDESAIALFFAVDILQMAGLSLIVMSIVRRFLPWRKFWLVLAIFIATISPLLWGSLDSWPFTSLLWGSGENDAFPLFPWIIYPLIGMFYSYNVQNPQKIGSLMKQWPILGFTMILIGGLIWGSFSNSIIIEGDYYRSGPAVHLVILGFVFLWLPACRWVVMKTPDNVFLRTICLWSKNVTVVYFIQWVLIGWGPFVFGYMELSPTPALAIGIVTVFLTHYITKVYLYFLSLPQKISIPF
ncbi:MAG: DUF1624 domain-containing protein [Desulfobacterales bacterium]|nr:DUF1624 domain-containing protein [Desulfobacterales bacterium]